MLKPDSLIFDMDGTLWDNVDTYADSWNMGLERTGHDKKVTRADILGLMGKEARVMLNSILPGSSTEEQDRLFVEVISAYQALLGSMTPKIFDGMHEMLEKL
ncbi:MAG: HAD hydrolase-like protein, partial [Petrimonas sp.]|nr:HAD hydrolase-like protein [Petrimonas sp.]